MEVSKVLSLERQREERKQRRQHCYSCQITDFGGGGAETLWWEIVRWRALRLGSSSNTRLTLCVPIRLLPYQAPPHFYKGGPVGSLRGRISVSACILWLSSSYHLLRLISQNKLSGPSVCQSICVVDLQWYDAVEHLELCILSPIIEPHLKMLWTALSADSRCPLIT